jgi:glycosyl transferase family 2
LPTRAAIPYEVVTPRETWLGGGLKRRLLIGSSGREQLMRRDRVVLAVNVFDNADTLRDCTDWHLAAGIDFVVASDMGSTDGSQDILADLAKSGSLSWSLQPRKNIDGYDPLTELAKTARDRFEADWIILLDADEFLCVTGEKLHDIVRTAGEEEIAVLTVPRFNMTGTLPASDQHYLEILNLRIDRPTAVSPETMISGDLGVPQVFAPINPKTIVRASRFVEYGAGAHTALTSRGNTGQRTELKIVHYPFRNFQAYEQKVENIVAFMAVNPHLPPGWGWHWRRFIRIREAGQLKAEYERQFVSPQRACELIHDQTCSIDDTLADWNIARKRAPHPEVPAF